MSKHTPGPWSTHPEGSPEWSDVCLGNSDAAVSCSKGYKIADVKWQRGSLQAIANARLIAAAPDLLDALDNCVTNINATAIAQNDVSYIIRRFKAINEIARAAIAKATGE